MNKSFWKGFFAGLLFWIIAIYSFFRIYWIMEVGLKYFRWHAILWLYGSIAAIFAGVSYWLYKHGKLNSPAAQKKYLRVLGLVAGLLIADYEKQRNTAIRLCSVPVSDMLPAFKTEPVEKLLELALLL